MSGWTKEEPTRGDWWLSIAPEKRPLADGRNDFPAVIRCVVDSCRLVKYDKAGDWLELDQDWFKGAQWKRVDPDPADPFAETQLRYSQDDDLP